MDGYIHPSKPQREGKLYGKKKKHEYKTQQKHAYKGTKNSMLKQEIMDFNKI